MHDTHVYVAVRRDIPLAHQAVQAVHAGICAGRELIASEIQHPNLVLLTVPDLPSLLTLRAKCDAAGIRATTFVEEDLGHQPTAIATQPINGKGRRLFRNLPLFAGA